MINVTYDGKYSITVKGHAGQAPHGSDIVCAGASTLIYALADAVRAHEDELAHIEITLNKGNGRVAVKPDSAFRAEWRRAFETVMRGYVQLCASYPDYIRLLPV